MGAFTGIRRSASTAHRNRPFITDIAANRRTEFTGALFEQWVAKTSNWLEAEFGRELQLHVDLPAHWLWPVMVAALDELEGTLVPADRADLVMRMGVDPTCEIPVLAVHDHPMALPFGTQLPADHVDVFLEVRGGADVRSWGPAHTMPIIDDGDRLWLASELATETFESEGRIAVLTRGQALRTVTEIAAVSVLPWRSTSSLVIAVDPDAVAGEQVTRTIDLRA